MLKSRFSLWITGPTILLSLLLLALCSVAAVVLYKQQATSADILDENVSSTQVANDLKNTLADLVLLLRDGKEQVEPLHQKIRKQLAEARAMADKEDESNLVSALELCLDRYFVLWNARSDRNFQEYGKSARACLLILETEAVPRCRELQSYNAEQIRKSEYAHRKTVNGVIIGLLGLGVLGALAGLLFGYGVARQLRHSIYHLRVRVQDAASMLGKDLPAVALDEDASLHQIQQQMQTVVRDIEQVVQKLQQREREILRAEQLAALGQLAAGMAHEIRNPLTSIKLLVQTLREDVEAQTLNGEGQERAEDLEVIELEIRRMERCLQLFLDFARPPKPDCKPLDLAVPVDWTLALITGRARKQRVKIEFKRPPGPMMVAADAEQLQQLLVNLALNALDAMPHGGTLSMNLRQLPNSVVELRVCDTGPGIAAKVLPTLFQPFVSTKDTGLGLGLVTSRRIAETHQGTLEADNLSHSGACFTLRLPGLSFSPSTSMLGRKQHADVIGH
jgi:two-component system, NtrC family, sensor histidine kinase HydH